MKSRLKKWARRKEGGDRGLERRIWIAWLITLSGLRLVRLADDPNPNLCRNGFVAASSPCSLETQAGQLGYSLFPYVESAIPPRYASRLGGLGCRRAPHRIRLCTGPLPRWLQYTRLPDV